LKQAGIGISPRKQPKQARSTQLVENVLEAAVRVLSREGARHFTTRRVAQAAGISVGSLYQYFPNKESILFRLQTDEWQATVALLLGILDSHDRTPFDRLRMAIVAFLRSEYEEAPIRAALADAAPLFRDTPEAFKYRRAAFRRFLAFWRELLPQLSPRQRLQAIDLVMMTVEAIGNRVSEDRRSIVEVEACATALADMLCAYLGQLRRTTRADVTSGLRASHPSFQYNSRPRSSNRFQDGKSARPHCATIAADRRNRPHY
jgi:AcrR family transcriptional regulator